LRSLAGSVEDGGDEGEEDAGVAGADNPSQADRDDDPPDERDLNGPGCGAVGWESAVAARHSCLVRIVSTLALAALIALAWTFPAHGSEEAPHFRGSVERIDSGIRARMTGVSWHRGCPVGFADLGLLTVSHWGFDGRRHRGRLVVNRDATAAMLEAMRSLYRLRFPIRQMRLVDAYGADDHRSMAADNTSAFNCRFVAGSDRVSSAIASKTRGLLNPRSIFAMVWRLTSVDGVRAS
jgi:hypothetical protein